MQPGLVEIVRGGFEEVAGQVELHPSVIREAESEELGRLGRVPVKLDRFLIRLVSLFGIAEPVVDDGPGVVVEGGWVTLEPVVEFPADFLKLGLDAFR